MLNNKNIFSKKKILIYGLGKSGLSAYKFLKNNNEIFLYDDEKDINKKLKIKKKITSYKKISKIKIDIVIISPGVDINKCRLKKFLRKNIKKIF